MSIRRLWREPFVHFALLGVLLFGIDAYLQDRSGVAGADEIVVTAGRINQLAAVFTKTWSRPPTPAELQGLVDDYVLAEAMYRQGVALGVDQDDTVIRRRVRQKMEFFIDSLANTATAPDEALDAWLKERPEAYLVPARFSFHQVYLNPDRHGEALASTAEALLNDLRNAGPEANQGMLGDGTILPPTNIDYRTDVVVNSYGEAFANQLDGLPIGEWTGPIESTYGLHLVYMEAKTPSREPVLAEVRDAVERDWRQAQRVAAASRYYDQALENYDVTVEWSEFLDSTAASEQSIGLTANEVQSQESTE